MQQQASAGSNKHHRVTMNYWAVVQTEAQRERHVLDWLKKADHETYLPCIKERSRIIPLFPTYLFVRLIENHWYAVRWTPHVTRLLMSGDKPAQLPEAAVEQIRKRETDGIVRLATFTPRLKKGQQVRIVRGSFEGRLALYDGQSSHERERVLLELLGQMVPVELPACDVAPLSVASERKAGY
jgi:transcriptional antiterminator RfaH